MTRRMALSGLVAAIALYAGSQLWTRNVMSHQKPEFHLAVDLAHPIEVVWGALTQKSVVDTYYLAPLRSDVGGVGTEISYGPPDAKLIAGTVLTSDAPRLLSHSFRFGGDTASPDTTVTYRLERTAKGTRLEILHAGYPIDSQGYADVAGGWPVIADGLKSVLDSRR